jgi:hypothetical protein
MTNKYLLESGEEIEQYNNVKRNFWKGLKEIAGI